MDYFDALISVNKVSIFFFVITIIFIAYEFYLFKKSGKNLQDVPQKDAIKNPQSVNTVSVPPMKMSNQKSFKSKALNKNLMIVGIVLFVIFGALFALTLILTNRSGRKVATTTIQQTQLPTATPSAEPTEEPTVAPTEAPTEEPSPTAILLAQEEPSPEVTSEEEVVVASEEPTQEPTETEELPVTGNVSAPFVIFTVATVFFFLAFIL